MIWELTIYLLILALIYLIFGNDIYRETIFRFRDTFLAPKKKETMFIKSYGIEIAKWFYDRCYDDEILFFKDKETWTLGTLDKFIELYHESVDQYDLIIHRRGWLGKSCIEFNSIIYHGDGEGHLKILCPEKYLRELMNEFDLEIVEGIYPNEFKLKIL